VSVVESHEEDVKALTNLMGREENGDRAENAAGFYKIRWPNRRTAASRHIDPG
jgi:hypothetical protein